MRQATATMRKIGTELIEQRREPVLAETEKVAHASEKADAIEGDRTVLGRDLLSVLSTYPLPMPYATHAKMRLCDSPL